MWGFYTEEGLGFKIQPKQIFGTTCPPTLVHHQQQQQQQQHQLFYHPNCLLQQQQRHRFTGQLRDKVKLVIMRGAMAIREQQQQLRINRNGNQVNQSRVRNNNDASQLYLSSLATVCIFALIYVSQWPMETYCLEQDAEILKPVASLAKSVIKTVTLGVPLEVHFEPTGMVKNFAQFTWRTGFPVSMPRGFITKAQDFYNRVKLRVDQSEVKDVERKSLANLKLDLDNVVDSIVEEVRQSPDGLYTDYLKTRVNGVPLEDACTAVGVQLKAYGVDLTNYRNIAGAVLGIPIVPTVASTIMNVASMANLDTMKNFTHSFTSSVPLNPATGFLTHLPGSALNSVSQVSNSAPGSLNSMSEQLPMQNLVKAMPLSPQLWRQLQPQSSVAAVAS